MKNTSKLVYTAIITSMVFFVGCNNSRTADINLGDSYLQETTTSVQTTTTTQEVTTSRELTLQEKLQNTCWIGANGTRNIMSFTFTDNTITVSSMLSSGWQDEDITGYWTIDDQKITVYSDINLTEMITYYDYSLHKFQNGDTFLYMEGMYFTMADTPTKDFSTVCDDLTQSFNDISAVTDGGFWVGTNDVDVDFLVCNYGDIYLYLANKNTPDTTYYDGKWGLTLDTFYIIDNETSDFIYYKWNFNPDTSVLTLTNSDGTSVEFSKTEATGFGSVMEIVNAHLDGTYEDTTTTTEDTTTTTLETTTTTEDTTTENYLETTTIATTYENPNNYFNNETQYVNPDNSDYDDSKDYYDNYVKSDATTFDRQPKNYYNYNTTTYAYDYNSTYYNDSSSNIYGY